MCLVQLVQMCCNTHCLFDELEQTALICFPLAHWLTAFLTLTKRHHFLPSFFGGNPRFSPFPIPTCTLFSAHSALPPSLALGLATLLTQRASFLLLSYATSITYTRFFYMSVLLLAFHLTLYLYYLTNYLIHTNASRT